MPEIAAEAGRPDAQLFYDAFKASPIGMALENMEGRPLFANPALCAMLGFSEDEIRGKHCVDFSPREDAAKDWALFEQLRAGLLKRYSLEKQFFRRDGSLFRGRLSISLLESRPYPLVVAMVEEIRDEDGAQEEAPKSQPNLDRLTGLLVQAQEEERAEVARELRYNVNDRLMSLLANLDRIEQDPPESAGEKRLKIGETRKELLDIAEKVSRLSHHLHPWNVEYLGLAKAAGNICKEFGSRERVEIEFAAGSIPQEPSKEVSFCLYRLLQIALPIAARNSASRKLEVSLSVRSDEMHLELRDPERCIQPASVMPEDAPNFTGVMELVKLFGGDVSFDSQSQKGTTLHARVPLSPNVMKSARPDR